MFAKTAMLSPIAAAALLISGAATAATTAPAGDATVGIAKSVTKTSRIDNPAQRYCIVSEVTGSRIPQRACDTLASWQDRGVDPRQLPRR